MGFFSNNNRTFTQLFENKLCTFAYISIKLEKHISL